MDQDNRWVDALNKAVAEHCEALAKLEQAEAASAGALAERTGNTADISDAAISRLGGGAALGTVIGTVITPGIGTVAGAVLGGVVGAFAPNILGRRHSTKNNEAAQARYDVRQARFKRLRDRRKV